jgi:hypothetical protein
MAVVQYSLWVKLKKKLAKHEKTVNKFWRSLLSPWVETNKKLEKKQHD